MFTSSMGPDEEYMSRDGCFEKGLLECSRACRGYMWRQEVRSACAPMDQNARHTDKNGRKKKGNWECEMLGVCKSPNVGSNNLGNKPWE